MNKKIGKKRMTNVLLLIIVILLIVIGVRLFRQDKVTDVDVELNETEIVEAETDDVETDDVETDESQIETTSDDETTSDEEVVIETEATQSPSIETTNEVILNTDIIFEEFPFVLEQELDSRTRYSVYFETDKQIQFVVYSEERFNQWQDSEFHTISKASTKLGSVCCDTERTFNVGINEGEGGIYYFVFDDVNLPDKENLPSKGKLTIIKTANI
jgi:hypothetical protein